jgi:hypothetical protein
MQFSGPGEQSRAGKWFKHLVRADGIKHCIFGQAFFGLGEFR